MNGPRTSLGQAHRLVVKLGTQVVMGADGLPALDRLEGLLASVSALKRQGREVLLVSSGAVGLGQEQLGLRARPRRLADKQACAAVGQGRLMALYQQGFARLGLVAAQVLLSERDFADRRGYLNLRTTLERLLELGAVPIINENDTVSTAELASRKSFTAAPVFGDNDMLSALVAGGVGADALLLLSDVDGLYTGNPRKDPGARLLSRVAAITPEIEACADGQSARGRGGMASKLAAVKAAGTWVVIADGGAPGILDRVAAGEPVGTLFEPQARLRGRQRWIAHASRPAGRIRVNAGARQALLGGRASLLPAGVLALEGAFEADDVVTIADERGRDFARGLATLDWRAAGRMLAGGGRIAPGARGRGALVSRDTLVLLEGA
jgi:glutamate 5-kinase